jgi:AhpD family alkylhydroperoxidase
MRLNPATLSSAAYKNYLTFALTTGTVEAGLSDLVNIRVSQINGCAFCLDMHVKEATIRGERALRLHHVAIWRESPLFSPRERAAFRWAEQVTRLGPDGVADEEYEAARTAFTEQELSDLTMAVVAINGWNRLNIAFPKPPGSLDAMFGLEKAGLN